MTALYSPRVGEVLVTLMIRRGEVSQADTFEDRLFFLPESLVRDHHRTDIGGGLRWSLSDGAYVDLAGEYRHTRIEESFSTPLDSTYYAERVSNQTYSLRSRAFLKVSPRSALIPMAEIILADSPLPISELGKVSTIEGHLLRAGCGWNYFPDTDKFLLMTLEYRHGKIEYDNRLKYSYPYYTAYAEEWSSFNAGVGVETRFLSWLTLLGSFNYEYSDWRRPWMTSGGVLVPFDDGHVWGADLRANLGVGVHLGRFDLDLALTNDYPRNISGFIGHESFLDRTNWLAATVRAGF